MQASKMSSTNVDLTQTSWELWLLDSTEMTQTIQIPLFVKYLDASQVWHWNHL